MTDVIKELLQSLGLKLTVGHKGWSRWPGAEALSGMMVTAWNGWEVVRFWISFKGRTIRISWRTGYGVGEKAQSRVLAWAPGRMGCHGVVGKLRVQQVGGVGSGGWVLLADRALFLVCTPSALRRVWHMVNIATRIRLLNSSPFSFAPYFLEFLFSCGKEEFFISVSKLFISKSQDTLLWVLRTGLQWRREYFSNASPEAVSCCLTFPARQYGK